MINFDDYANENRTAYNKNWPCIPDHPYRILIIVDSGSGKTNLLLNLIKSQPDIDKIYLYAKDLYESKYQYLINKRKGVGINHFNNPKAFVDYSNYMHDVYKNIDDYNLDKENKILIVAFITKSYFKVPKYVRPNTTHFFIAKIPNKRELQKLL